MNYTIYFSICSLFYIIMLLRVIKKRNLSKTSSNKIFKILAVTNFVALIVEIICTISAMKIKSDTIFMEFIVRVFLMCLLAWMLTYIVYIFTILYNGKRPVKNGKKILTICSTAIFIISCIIVMFLPVKYDFDKIYSYGPAINYVNYFSDILLGICLIYMFKNLNKTNSNKCTPFFAFIAGGVAMSIIQSYDPRLLLANTIETFVTYMVYFTLDLDSSENNLQQKKGKINND